MKTLRSFGCLLFCMLLLASCAIQIQDSFQSTKEPESAAEILTVPAERYTVMFDENEIFSTESTQKASAQIDSAILAAVKLLNTLGDESILISDCDYDARPKARDLLKYPHSKEIYDYILAYATFVKGKAICSGYAQAFYRLCREAGISCWYCRGTTPEGRHAWNMLDTDDGVVYVDVTWYDTEKIVENYRDGKEQYLFMTQEDFDYYGYVQESCQ